MSDTQPPAGALRPIERNPVLFDAFAVFQKYAREHALSIRDDTVLTSFIDEVQAQLTEGAANESFLYGLHAQAMFQSMVVELGGVTFIKQEDAGEVWMAGAEVKIPDFRVVSAAGESLLIEVKNCYRKPLTYRFEANYFQALLRYAAIAKTPLKLAIFWARLFTWTVCDAAVAKRNGRHYELHMFDAMKANELASFGDLMVGTTPPLSMRMTLDKTHTRVIERQDETHSTIEVMIAGVSLWCAEEEITDSREQNIALTLLLYGDWENAGPYIDTDDDGEPDAIVYDAFPMEDHQQGFEIVGSLSEMYSRAFALATVKDDRIQSLSKELHPGSWGKIIPPDYKGDKLRLWIFKHEPARP